MRTLVWQASAKEPNFRERRKAEVQLRGTPQPVEKVVVGPVGSPKEPENKSKTLRKQRIRPPNRGHNRARRSFSTRWGILGNSHSPGPIPSEYSGAYYPSS